MNLESLETRRMLAGVTLLTHGLGGNVDGWIEETADGIADRLGGPANCSIYTMKVRDSDGTLTVTSFEPDDGYGDYRSTTLGELIIRHDWSNISSGPYSTTEVANATAEYLLTPRTSKKLPPLAELQLHLVGHSRGASLEVELSRLLGRRNVVVDHVTFLDPHPVDGIDDILNIDYDDAPMAVFDSVVFADNYWRTDGNTQNVDPDGEPVAGAHEGDLNASVQQNFFLSAHNAVTAYYVGTVDTDTSSGGDHPVYSSWYQDPNPARDETGYVFSRIGGGARPADGVGPLAGGSVERASAGQASSQWPSAVWLRPTTGSTFEQGTAFAASLRAGDRDSSATYRVYLDTDYNPYNGAGSPVADGSFSSGAIADRTLSITTAGLTPRKYALAAEVVDSGGRTRWFYGRTITLTEAPPIGAIAGRILTINATSGDDLCDFRQVDPATFRATLNGRSQDFANADFERIELYCGAGDDTLTVDANVSTVIYAFGDTGRDSLTGGSGNDTLTGAGDKNFLDGKAGDDRLNGSGAPDTLWGSEGADRLYGNGGDDRFEGGGGVDRVFGGDGNDSAVGGGSNDKLYGEAGDDTLIGGAGADILDGGAGDDTADEDAADTRVSIEVLA